MRRLGTEACYNLREIQKTRAIMAGEDKKVVVVVRPGAGARWWRRLPGQKRLAARCDEPPGSPALTGPASAGRC